MIYYNGDDYKICGNCQRSVQVDANKCHYCGASFFIGWAVELLRGESK
jgi:RNA polymerase subunit RPABC4/transcription elongation factor Spt4